MKDKKMTENEKIIDSYDYLADAASTTECTGLMPTPADSEYENESYQEIYHFHKPAVPKKTP